MRVAIVGAGFTGLTAGLELSRRGIKVEIFEAAEKVGGLAVGFRRPGWKWTAEKFYHHIFTNDTAIIKLSKELGVEPEWHRPVTAVYYPKVQKGTRKYKKVQEGNIYQFDSARDLLLFPGLGLVDKLRMGAVLAGLKFLPDGKFLEKYSARDWLIKTMGKKGFEMVWESLLTGKFADLGSQVNMAWFWARIKKRTARLGTFTGGFQQLAERMADEIKKNGGEIILNRKVELTSFALPVIASPEGARQSHRDCFVANAPRNDSYLQKSRTAKLVEFKNVAGKFDAVLSTLPEPNTGIDYLDAHILFLEMKRPIFPKIYWLNILDRSFPFLVVGEHTNFVAPEYFGGLHLAYIGNYLPQNHHLFSLSSNEVLDLYMPWLKKINSTFSKTDVIEASVFRGSFAQPVMTVNYSKLIPPMRRDGNLYVANQAMIYPWDRGTNYAVELGQRAAKIILNEQK